METPHDLFMAAAEVSLQKLKQKQIWTLLLMVAIGFPVPMLLSIQNVIEKGNHLWLAVVFSILYLVVLICLLPIRSLNYAVRGTALITILFCASLLTLLNTDITGPGYLQFALVIFCTNYFFTRRTLMIVTALSLLLPAAILTMRLSGLAETPFLKLDRQYISLSVIKYLVFAIIAVLFNIIGSQQINVLKKALLESIESRLALGREKSATVNYLDSIPGLFILYNENWEVERWNKNVITQLGYSEEDLIRKSILSLIDEGSRQIIRQGLSDVLVNGESYIEGMILRKDGSKVPMAFHSRKVDTGNRTLICAIATDLTEKRHLEKEVQEVQKMEALGALAGGVAHDLNNVLAGISGYADIVRDTVTHGEMPSVQHLDTILTSCVRAAGIVKQILMFSRRSETKKIPIQLRSVVRDAVKLIRHTIPKSIEAIEDLPRDDQVVNADVNQIHQIVMNLCTNAWHAMRDKGGTLTVSLGTADVDRQDIPAAYNVSPGLFQKISITDTGTGIPKDILGNIFTPFFTTKPEGQGTGLGLAVVDKIIRSHDGFLTVDTIVGKGTTFSVYVPLADQNELLNESEIPQDIPRGTETILIVDDEPQIRESSDIMLKRLGYTVLTAEDGRQGLDTYSTHHDDIRLVITDLAMPKMDGSKMAASIRENNPDLPILLCTGYSEAMEIQKLPTEQFSAQMHKPLRMQKLATVIRHLIDGKSMDSGEFLT